MIRRVRAYPDMNSTRASGRKGDVRGQLGALHSWEHDVCEQQMQGRRVLESMPPNTPTLLAEESLRTFSSFFAKCAVLIF